MERATVFVEQKKGSRGGCYRPSFALLLVLLAIAIVAILYVMQMDAFFGPVVPGAEVQQSTGPGWKKTE